MKISFKKGFRTLLIVTVFSVVAMPVVFAGIHGENNPELLAHIRENSSNYVRYGGQSTGITYLIEKDSIHVDLYEPPKYIVGFKTVYYASNGMMGEHHREMARYNGEQRYLYDIASHKMYVERMDEDGNSTWEYLDETQYGSLEAYKSGKKAVIGAGVVAFYLVYDMNFYENDPAIAKLLHNVGKS